MTDKKRDLIITIVLSAVVAVLVALGFNVTVVPIIQPEQPEARAIRERISIDARDDAYLYDGADLLMYSDDHSTNKIKLDGGIGAVQVNATAVATSTPGILIKAGYGNPIEVQNVSATPVFYVDSDGAATYSGFSSGGGAVDGDTTITGTLTTSEGITATTGGVTAVAGGLTATAGGLTVTAGGATVTAGGLTVTAGNTALNGGLTMDTSAFSVADTTGNTVVSGTLTVSNTSSLVGALDMNAAVISNIGNAGTDFGSDGSLALAGPLTVAKYEKLTPQAFTLVDGNPITPTSTYVVLSSTGAATTSTTVPVVAAGHGAGELLILRNDNASDVITIDGTGGTVECKANVALGADDTLTLIYNGAAWNCVAGYDNS